MFQDELINMKYQLHSLLTYLTKKISNFCGKRHQTNAWKTKAMKNYVNIA